MVCVAPEQGVQIVYLGLKVSVALIHMEVWLPVYVPLRVVSEKTAAIAPICEVDVFLFSIENYVINRKSAL